MSRVSIIGTIILLFCLVSCGKESTLSTEKNIETVSVEDFSLLDQNGNFHELYYYANKKAVVLIVQGNGCPIIRKSFEYLNTIQQKYSAQGVVFLMINANRQDSREDILKEVKDFDIQMPVLKDETQMIVQGLQLTRTAEAVLINPKDWTVVYQGGIHDGLGYGTEKKEIKNHYLAAALDSFLEGKRGVFKKTPVKGCVINFSELDARIEYSKDIAAILLQKCYPCHSYGGMAPWAMDGYERVKGWGAMIRQVVRTQRMPPWQADPQYGQFKNDLGLNEEEKRKILLWAEQGFSRGQGEDILNKAQAPHTSKWVLGNPDILFSLKEEQTILAAGVEDFRFIEADKIVDRDVWVRAIDIMPGNVSVVHHCNLSVEWPEDVESFDAAFEELGQKDRELWANLSGMNIERGSVFAGYSPGTGPFILPEETGIFIPKGARMIFRMHYISTGKEEKDTTQAALYLLDEPPKKVLTVDTIVNRDLYIPAGEKHYALQGEIVLEKNIQLIALQPHMHYRGKSMRFIVERKDGSREIILSVPNYKFHWQRRYTLKQSMFLPKGTRVIAEAVYDNSAENENNPDATKDVSYGPYSQTEMFTGILFYVEQGDAE